jgi:nucleotide-binding universal stress UspA family protein
LDTGTVWGYVILCTFAAIISKGIGEGLPARFLGKFSWTESAVFGVLMSAKGLVALIILNLGITHNIITERLFAILVVAVLVNTMLVSPLVALVFRIGGNPYTAASPQFMNPNEEAINVMVCTNYSLTAPLMVSLAQSLVNYKQKTVPKVFVTRLFEASNRPSDLVSASNPDKAKKNDDVIIAAAQRAKMLRLDVAEVISRMSSNYGEDIATEAVQRGVDLIVMGTKKTTLRGTTMNKVISKCSSNVAVVLQRSLTGALKIDSILFVYKSGAHDELALDYALKIVEARQARLAVIKIEQEEDARSSSILQRLFRKNKIEFRTVKTDEELQNALDVEVKNHLYSIAMTGWESPAIPLLLTLDETLPLVAVYANRNKEHAPVQVDVSTTDSQPNSKNFVLDEEEDMDSADNAPSNNNAQEGSSMEESVNNSEELIVIENKPIKKKQKQVDEYVKLEDIE